MTQLMLYHRLPSKTKQTKTKPKNTKTTWWTQLITKYLFAIPMYMCDSVFDNFGNTYSFVHTNCWCKDYID